MNEKLLERADTYFRSPHTLLARGLKKISPKEGLDYRQSEEKQALDISIAIPLALVSIPIVVGFAAAVKLQDGGSALYTQDRIGKDGKIIPIVKIRSLHQEADKDSIQNQHRSKNGQLWNDPRSTRLGTFMRKYGIDELPQIWQVLKGRMSMVGIRANLPLAFEELRGIRPLTYRSWFNAYLAEKPSLFNPLTAFGTKPNLSARYHLDTFYARRASLGLDLYIIWSSVIKRLFRS